MTAPATLDRPVTAAHIGFAMNASSFCAKMAPRLLSLMRIVIGLLFACHGGQKLWGYPPGGHKIGSIMTLMGLAAILEWREGR
jgi:putative oxidoreductase